ILHSFQGNKKIVDKFNNLNVWYSLSPGCFSESNYEMIKYLPIDKILLESDAPSMFNQGIYQDKEDEDQLSLYFKDADTGKYKNNPMSVIPLAKKISTLRSVDLASFLKQIYKNNRMIINNLL